MEDFTGRRARSARETAYISPPLGNVRRLRFPFPGAPGKFPDGQNAPQKTLSREPTKTGAPTLKRFCPAGQTASNTHTGSAPCPAGQGSGRKDAPASFSARNACLRQDGTRRRENSKPNTSSPGTPPPGTLPRGIRPPGSTTARKPENSGFPKPESPMTCIALPPASSMGYLGHEHARWPPHKRSCCRTKNVWHKQDNGSDMER